MNTPAESRLLTIHCHGPAPLAVMDMSDHGPERGRVELWYATLDAHRQHVEEYLSLLDPDEQERAARFRFPHDRERFVIAHGLLRSLLGRYLGTPPAELRIARGPYGKPFIAGTDLRFNLSDTKDALLIAFTQGDEIGADIETMARTVDHIAVSEHYFTPDEVRSIHAAEATGAGKRRFLELWTRKEAVLKASGVGIMDDLRVLSVGDAHNTMMISHEAFVRDAAEQYHVGTWHLGGQHIISVAGTGPIEDVGLRVVQGPEV